VIGALLRVARKHDLWVLCDEAYEELWFTEERPAPVWAHPLARDRAIATHTLSKGYGLAGARVGFTHGPDDVMRTIRGVQTFQTYCAPRPMQLGAVRALDEGDAWLEHARAAYRAAGYEAADALGVARPAGGTFLFFDASPHMDEGEPVIGFLERCLDAGVLLTPGGACGRDYERWVRVCFTSVPPDELHEALEALRPVLRR
jgi:N-succinyldiaminopimelate aminotransferase